MKRYTTVVVTVHNREKYLRQCLDSIVGQTLEDIEILCVDDASTDGSVDILREYERKDARVRLFSLEKNVGVQRARNMAIDKARGEYIIFVDDDDWISPDCVENCMESFGRHPDADCVMIPEMRVRPDGEVYAPGGRADFESITGEEAFLLTMPWRVAGIFCVRLEYQRRHPFDNACRYFGDENTGRGMLLAARKVVMSKGMYYYRMHGESVCHKVGIGQYSRLYAQRKFADELRENGVDERLRRRYETFCWDNVAGAYMRYYAERGSMTPQLRRDALRLIRQAYAKMDFRLVDRRMKRKFGYVPFAPLWWLFRIQEEMYFTARTLLGRMSLDVD